MILGILSVETVKQLPDWAISMIAIAALLSGVLGGRSQVAAQIIQHVIAIIGLLFTRVGTRNTGAECDSPDKGTEAKPAACAVTEETTESSSVEYRSRASSNLLDAESHLAQEQRVSLISMTQSSSSASPATTAGQVTQV